MQLQSSESLQSSRLLSGMFPILPAARLCVPAARLSVPAARLSGSVLQDSCVRQALRCRRLTRLITLQLHFLGSGQSTRIINLGRQDLPGAILALPRFYQVSWAPSGPFCSG